ncbi:MAG: anti-sigma regulatory factor [Candidatus Hodarchaeota archaeon]
MSIIQMMTKTLEVKKGSDLIKARQLAREFAKNLGFTIINQTKIVTAVSELIRNVLDYALEGKMIVESVIKEGKKGLIILVMDKGPGIENIELAMTDGYSTSGGLGKGLSGSKKLMDEFEIKSELGVGTEVKVTKWVNKT